MSPRAYALAVAVCALAACPRPQPPPRGEGVTPSAPNAPNANPTTPPPVAANPEAVPAVPATPTPPTAPKPRPAKIKIIVRSNPPKAYVRWGKKVLGQTPVTLERPRDSGPIDLIVLAEGYFPVHTRAYTFRNDALSVRLTKLADRMTLFGAKKEIEAPSPNLPEQPVEPPPALAAPPGVAPLEPAQPNQ